MSSTSQLTVAHPYTPSSVPSEDQILAAAIDLIESTKSWKEGKSYSKHTVRTFSRPKGPGDGAAWHCRASEHSPEDATFDEFWSKLGVNKAENEKQYVPDIHKATLVKQISTTQSIWTLYYTFTPPVSPRVFTVLQVTHLDTSTPRKSGLIVSLPIDLTADVADAELAKLEEKGVKGRYVSIERLLELDNGNVEWRMATSSTPGGHIPQFVAEKSMPSKISDDVPHFIKWFHTVRSNPHQEAPTTTDEASATQPILDSSQS